MTTARLRSMQRRSMQRRTIRWVVVVVALGWIMLNLKSVVRGLTTNTAAIAVDADDPELRPVELKTSPVETAERIESWAESKSIWNVESNEVDGGIATMHLTRTTRVFRFVDDVYVNIAPTDGGSVLTATSKSRLGNGDLGQNPRNLKELIAVVRG